LVGRKIMKKIFEEEIAKEMKWVGIAIIVFILVFLFTILVVSNAIISDIKILEFINECGS
jgi:cell division protein FtsX